jgi:hypothetical protein
MLEVRNDELSRSRESGVNDETDPAVLEFVQKYPRANVMAAPVLTAFEGQPYRSILHSVWVWSKNDAFGPKLFSGPTPAAAIQEAEKYFFDEKLDHHLK